MALLVAVGGGCSDDGGDGNQPPNTTQPDADDLQEGDIDRRGEGDGQDERNTQNGTVQGPAPDAPASSR